MSDIYPKYCISLAFTSLFLRLQYIRLFTHFPVNLPSYSQELLPTDEENRTELCLYLFAVAHMSEWRVGSHQIALQAAFGNTL